MKTICIHFLSLSSLFIFAACGGEEINVTTAPESGTELYKIWLKEEIRRSGTCTDTELVSSNRLNDRIVKIYKTSKDKYIFESDYIALPTGNYDSFPGAIPGEKSAEGYSFAGEESIINTLTDQVNSTNTSYRALMNPIEKDKWETIEGKITFQEVTTCTGTACTTANENCSIEMDFSGIKLKNIQLLTSP